MFEKGSYRLQHSFKKLFIIFLLATVFNRTFYWEMIYEAFSKYIYFLYIPNKIA